MNDQPRARGECLCGEISFEVHGKLRDVINCHCHRCRRFTGHHMAATAADEADVRLHDPESRLAWHLPAEGSAYGFCRGCGSSLFWRGRDGQLSICAGVLDPPTHLRTASAWWISEASDYHQRMAVPELDLE